jgi:hypothetical protein
MLKKQATGSLKQSIDKIKDRIDTMVEGTEELIKATGMPTAGVQIPPKSLLENLIGECEDHVFWRNFKKAAPMLFCALMEHNNQIKQVRDMSFMEELLKVKSLSALMKQRLEESDAGVDVIEYSLATQMLENKLSVLKSLNTTVEGDDDKKMTLNVQGTNKAIQIDLVKLKEAITFLDNSVEEKNASAEDYMTKVEDIDISSITEEEFVEKAVALIGDVKKNEQNNKVLSKDCFIRIFKYTGDYAKMRSQALKKSAQEDRCQYFNVDHKKYYDALQKTIQEEEKAYEKSSEILFEKLSISPEMFERS